jgi:hypothetical protein
MEDEGRQKKVEAGRVKVNYLWVNFKYVLWYDIRIDYVHLSRIWGFHSRGYVGCDAV